MIAEESRVDIHICGGVESDAFPLFFFLVWIYDSEGILVFLVLYYPETLDRL